MKHHELAQDFKDHFSLLKIASNSYILKSIQVFDSRTHEMQLYAFKWYEIELEKDRHIYDTYTNIWTYITYISSKSIK